MSCGPTPEDFRAKVFEDRETPGSWRVEKMNEYGGYQAVKLFTGPDARQQTIRYADRNTACTMRPGYSLTAIHDGAARLHWKALR